VVKIEKYNYKVYAHINKVNGKIYIGLTKQKPETRWKNGNGYKTHVYFYNAIKKHGWDNFEHEIIASGLTKEEAGNFEKLLIKKLDITNDEKGYNLDKGGTYGLHSEVSKEKMRGYKNPASRKVICITTGKIFDTTKQGASYYRLTRKNVGDCCTGMQEFTNRYGEGEALKWMYYEEYLEFGEFNICDIIKTNRVICLDTGQVYDNPYKAHEATGYKTGSIKRECLQMLYKGENKPVTNTKTNEETTWMYYEDYLAQKSKLN